MRTMTTPPTPTIRLTIPVRQDVHEVFSKMAAATGQPVGRCMAEWLADTIEGAEFMTSKLVQAREAPRTVIRQMRQELLGMSDVLTDALAGMKAGPRAAGGEAERAPPTRAALPPRSVIRGGKVHTTARKSPKV